MRRELFGTDGIRGVAGEFPLDQQTAHAFGVALGKWAAQRSDRPDVVIGMDTRESGTWLAGQVAGGLGEAGARTHFAGVVTTPGLAYLTRTEAFIAGVMVSASHNHYQDNGIKVFGHSGYKLPDEQEHLLEQEIFRLREEGIEANAAPVNVEDVLDRHYLDYLASTSGPLNGFSIVVDCGHGAASHLAPGLLERLGAKTHLMGCSPNGRNINLDCGALHVEPLRRRVLETGADIGVAFDGDADRAMFISHSGKLADGDCVLLLYACSLLERGELSGDNGAPVVIATVMSNLGLEVALTAHGIQLVRTPVGDKYVLEEMVRRDAMLGGEQSGHIIFRKYATTGDGLLTALRVLEVMRESGRNLDELTSELQSFPQRLINVRVRTRRPLEELAVVQDEIRAAEEFFGDSGRILVRFSGTETLARVMVEGSDQERVDLHSERIAAAIGKELGE